MTEGVEVLAVIGIPSISLSFVGTLGLVGTKVGTADLCSPEDFEGDGPSTDSFFFGALLSIAGAELGMNRFDSSNCAGEAAGLFKGENDGL